MGSSTTRPRGIYPVHAHWSFHLPASRSRCSGLPTSRTRRWPPLTTTTGSRRKSRARAPTRPSATTSRAAKCGQGTASVREFSPKFEESLKRPLSDYIFCHGTHSPCSSALTSELHTCHSTEAEHSAYKAGYRSWRSRGGRAAPSDSLLIGAPDLGCVPLLKDPLMCPCSRTPI